MTTDGERLEPKLVVLETKLQGFSQLTHQHKFAFLDEVISNCGLTELNYLTRKLDSILKLDFLARMPIEVRELIISYLDSNAVHMCKEVCSSWLDIIKASPAALLVLLHSTGG